MKREKTMFRTLTALGAIALAGFALPGPQTALSQEGQVYEIRVTNLTRGQQFTPILAATHPSSVGLFELGEPSSAALAILAEEGNTGPLAALLSSQGALDIQTSSGLLNPGASSTILVQAHGRADHLSVAAMLIPTNDGFFALNNIELPKGQNVLTLYSPVYDSGSERNDEQCASIPGPFFTECGGAGGGGAPSGGEEGYVHIHAGIHGIGNLNAAIRDWRNPAAQITIRRLR